MSARARRLRLASALALALALAGLLAAPAGADSLVYRPRHRLASELLPLAQAAVAGEGSAVVDAGTNSLVLIGPGPVLDRAEELLNQQDRGLRSVVVHYESRRVEELEAEGLRVDWQAAAGDLRVGSLPRPRKQDTVVAVRPEAARGRERGAVQGMIRVLEGRPGRISRGVDVPVARRTLTPYGVHEETTVVQAATGLEVTPHVMGDGRVRLDFAPFDERLGARLVGGPSVERTAVETSLVVAPGERVVVGSLARDSSSGFWSFFGLGSEHSAEERVMLVWVEVAE